HLLTEFLEGPLLGDLVRGHPRRRLGVSDAMRVGVHLGAALAHIHEQGFVHLDVKPWNAVVVRGRPVLIDLGSARRPGRLDRPVGTRPYMAPEQCRAGRVSAATDIYGLGITIYETLTGTLPFPRARRGVPLPQLVSVPVPARRRVPGIPATLDALLASCLAADPRDRPGLETLLPALNGFIRGGPSMWPATIHPAHTMPPRSARRRTRGQGLKRNPTPAHNPRKTTRPLGKTRIFRSRERLVDHPAH